jgi:hypothetical protein
LERNRRRNGPLAPNCPDCAELAGKRKRTGIMVAGAIFRALDP